MLKKVSLLGICLCLTLLTLRTEAFVRYEDKKPQQARDVKITGFIDYAPFGATETPYDTYRGSFTSVFRTMIDKIQKENNLKVAYHLSSGSYEDMVQKVRRGEIDILLGAYHDTELYRGIELIFPSIITNPVTVFMLPNRINEVKTTTDLKQLKGVRLADEIYSDFVEQQINEYSIEKVNTPYELFEKLFTKKADYILISQYKGLIEAYKLGLREQISMAHQSLWNIPLFVGVSKLSKYRKLLTQKLTHYAKDSKNTDILRERLIEIVTEAEKKHQGIVPPTFGLETLEETPEQ